MKPSTSVLAAPRGPFRRSRMNKPGEEPARLASRRIPRNRAQPSWVVGRNSQLRQVQKTRPHPLLHAMAARVVAPLPPSTFRVETGFYTPRDPALPVLRALPIKTAEVHIPVFPLLHGFAQESEMTLQERIAQQQVVPVPSTIFDANEKPALLHQAVVSFLASLRSHLATNKGRAAVSYSTRKRRPQKGTGRARISDLTAPQLRGGGRAHPKTPMRNWKRNIPGTAWVASMCTALSMRWRDGGIVCIDGIPRLTGEGIPGFLPGIPVPVMIQKGPEHEVRRLLQDRGLYGGTGTLFLLGHDVAEWHEGLLRLRSVQKELRETTFFVRTLRRLRNEGIDVKRALDVNIVEILRYRRILFDTRGLGDLIARLQSDRGLLGSEVWPLRLADSASLGGEPDDTEDDGEETEEAGTIYVDDVLHDEADHLIKKGRKHGAIQIPSPTLAYEARMGHEQRFSRNSV